MRVSSEHVKKSVPRVLLEKEIFIILEYLQYKGSAGGL